MRLRRLMYLYRMYPASMDRVNTKKKRAVFQRPPPSKAQKDAHVMFRCWLAGYGGPVKKASPFLQWIANVSAMTLSQRLGPRYPS